MSLLYIGRNTLLMIFTWALYMIICFTWNCYDQSICESWYKQWSINVVSNRFNKGGFVVGVWSLWTWSLTIDNMCMSAHVHSYRHLVKTDSHSYHIQKDVQANRLQALYVVLSSKIPERLCSFFFERVGSISLCSWIHPWVCGQLNSRRKGFLIM